MFQRLEIGTTSVTVVSVSTGGPRIVTLNHTATLPRPVAETASG
jgi:hypothetical protein